MSSINNFTRKENAQMLWDVISDEDIFRYLTPDIQTNIYTLFLNNINGFFENEKIKTTALVELNKKYILLILNHIKTTYPYKPSKIKIYSDPPVKELITYEEIQNDKKTQFERDFNKRQEEFEDSMTLKAPQMPDFSDKSTDEPIREMDKILKEMQAKRNYEVDQINKTYNQVDNWLTPQETSLKNDKFQQSVSQNQNQNQSRFKYLQELDQNITINNNNINNNIKKNVSFSNTTQIQTIHDNEDDEDDKNLFSKFKKVAPNNDVEGITMKLTEIDNPTITEDRIAKLERSISTLNDKIETIIQLLSK
jgi:hypothetical protein